MKCQYAGCSNEIKKEEEEFTEFCSLYCCNMDACGGLGSIFGSVASDRMIDFIGRKPEPEEEIKECAECGKCLPGNWEESLCISCSYYESIKERGDEDEE